VARFDKAKPDSKLVQDQLATLQALFKIWGAPAFMRFFIFIQAKKNSAIAMKSKQKLNTRIIPFVYNPIQLDIEEHIGQYNICLKPRQIGLTTWFLLRRIFVPALLTTGTNGFLISQSSQKATEHFSIVKRALKFIAAVNLQDPSQNDLSIALQQNLLHTAYSNRKEVIFDQIGNTISIGTAEVEEAGQGATLHHVVASEVSRWPGNPEETLANVKEAITLDGTLDIEATANGAGGYFYEEFFRAERKESEFTAHFHQWWYEPEYRLPLTLVQQMEMVKDLASDEQKLIDLYKLDLEQIAFRRLKKKSLRHNFDEKYPETAIGCFLVQGTGFFDKEVLTARYLELQAYKPLQSRGNGTIKIFIKRIPGRNYVLGADPAAGKQITSDSSDFSSAVVIDLDTGEQQASYRAKLPPEDFGLDLVDLGTLYNNALIAVERGVGADAGGDGGTVIMTIKNQKYGNLYKHKEHWKDRRKRNAGGFMIQDGLPMSGRTRPIALNKFKFIVDNYPELIHDKRTVEQCLTFVRTEKGRPEASPGNHDDDVLCNAIAQLARQAALGNFDPLISKAEKYGQTPAEEREEDSEEDE
jgi:hypothetical protein